MKYLVEICTDTFKSVENAIEGGAQRIELCSSLKDGGLTPSHGLIKKAAEQNQIKVNVLVRPRPGNFVYSDEDFDIMCQDIEHLKTFNINGIVSGVLSEDGNIDIVRTKKLVELSRPFEFTFHRAFDNCKNTTTAIIDIINTGADRVLTSGSKNNVESGMKTIIDLHQTYGDQIIIMPGGGINLDNAKIFLSHGIKEIHFSAGSFIKDTSFANKELGGMGHYLVDGDTGYKYSDIEMIERICNL